MEPTQLVVKAPDFRLFPLKLDFLLTLPDGTQLGPARLQGGIRVKGLPPGPYQLSGQFEGFDPFSLSLDLVLGQTTLFQPMQGASVAQRRAFRRAQGQDGKSTILYLQRRRRQAAQFWIGHCDSDTRLAALLSEADYNAIEDDEQRDMAFLSEFGKSQNQHWYDHDFIEAGYQPEGGNPGQRFVACSWAQEWGPELNCRAADLGLRDANCLIMMGGSPDKPQHWQFESPCDVDRPGVRLRYAGVIDFSYFSGGPAGR